MHANFIDPFHARDSLLHHVDPRVKLVLAVAFILTTALLPPAVWPGYILLFALILSLYVVPALYSYMSRETAPQPHTPGSSPAQAGEGLAEDPLHA